MDWRADLDPAFGREATRKAQHLSAVALHRKVPQRTWIGIVPPTSSMWNSSAALRAAKARSDGAKI
jgi:hypothetical protein